MRPSAFRGLSCGKYGNAFIAGGCTHCRARGYRSGINRVRGRVRARAHASTNRAFSLTVSISWDRGLMRLHGGNRYKPFRRGVACNVRNLWKYNPESGINNWNDSCILCGGGGVEGRQVWNLARFMLGRVIDEIFMDVSRFDFARAQREGRSNSCGNLCEYGLTRTDKLRGRGFEEERFCARCALSSFLSRVIWEMLFILGGGRV